ncbi:MAG: hypothetical protein ABIK31_02900 [candidate division WOR-3 bacterium]
MKVSNNKGNNNVSASGNLTGSGDFLQPGLSSQSFQLQDNAVNSQNAGNQYTGNQYTGNQYTGNAQNIGNQYIGNQSSNQFNNSATVGSSDQGVVNNTTQSWIKDSKQFQSKLSELFNYTVKYADLKVRDVIFTVRTLDAAAYLSDGFEMITPDDFDPKAKISDLMRKAYKYLVRALVKIVGHDGLEISLEEIAGCGKNDSGYYSALENGLLQNLPFVVISELILKYIEFYQEDLASQVPTHLLEKKS